MEEQMNTLNASTAHGAPRRNLFRLAGATVLGLAGLASAASRAEAATPVAGDGPDWPGKLKGRHRQVVDAYTVNDGRPLAFASTFLLTDAAPSSATSVVILRAQALPAAIDSAIWEKYKIGESLKIIDPETKAAAVKNPFLNPKPGVLLTDDMAIDRLLGKGVVFGACNVALHGLSKQLASNAGVSADDAAKEWAANLVPGITLLPSGVWGLNRAQEAGCTYCAGG
jgi:intracellular sulfur oxidation DsrE/DsrF family protein